ncbi:hypothetical protein SDC9_149864 [bioreactor metagenome]|uniref:Uncharacterized protein n=1 Tax=bioreactor metagenome TaxID=1076179 RepID=A0A645EKW5_9ZZZZ
MIAHNGLPAELHPAVAGRVYSGDDVERGGLTRAVGADQGDDLPFVDLQIQIVNRHHAAELHGRVFHAQHILTHCQHLPLPSRNASSFPGPTAPCRP